MKSIKFLIVALVVLAAVPMFAQSTSAPADLIVSATVNEVCTVSTTPVAFGVYDPLSAVDNDAGQGTVVVTCTKGADGLRIDLTAGANAASAVGTTRAMRDGATANYLSYELFTTAGRTIVFGSGAGSGLAIADAPSKAARSFDVFGRIPAGQDAAVGSYTDTVVATVNY